MEKKSFLTDAVLKSIVFGANDGIITTFAVVAGVAGANLSTQIVLIMGISNMVADGISMGIGDYLGERSAVRFRLNRHIKNNETERQIWTSSLATFIAFVSAGILPLAPYILELIGINSPNHFLASIIATILSLFFVGSMRTIIIKGQWWYNGLEMLLVGSIAAVAAYGLGAVVGNLLPVGIN